MNDELEPFDDISCEESIPEYWEGSPEPEPLTAEELEHQAHLDSLQRFREQFPETAAFHDKIMAEAEAFFKNPPEGGRWVWVKDIEPSEPTE